MKSRPPLPGKITAIDYPPIVEQRLGNGLQVLTIEDSRFPIVSIQLGFPVGRVNNPDTNLSLLQVALEAMKEGTRTRTSREIAEAMDYWAIHYSNELFMESTIHSVGVLESNLEQGLDLFAEILLDPVFPEDELRKIRARWASMLESQRSQPEFLASERLYLARFAGHPYAKNSIPVEHLSQASREQIQQSYVENYGPDGAILLFAGPVSPARSLQVAERFFGRWEGRPALVSVPRPNPDGGATGINLIHRPNSVQSRVLVGLPALPSTDPELIGLRVTNQVLGGSASARLFLRLREEKGYTYGACSRLKNYRADGLLLAGAGVRSDVTREAIEEILGELSKMSSGLPAAEELQRSQSEIIGSFIRQLETPASVGGLELKRRLSGLDPDYYRNLPSAIQNVTAENVRELAARFLATDRRIIVVVGDRRTLEGQLDRFGRLEIFDVHGKRLDKEEQ